MTYGGMKYLYEVKLSEKHFETGFTKHVVFGKPAHNFKYLRISKFPNEPGYLLLYYDKDNNEINDTYHDTLDGAFNQAYLEYKVEKSDWVKLM